MALIRPKVKFAVDRYVLALMSGMIGQTIANRQADSTGDGYVYFEKGPSGLWRGTYHWKDVETHRGRYERCGRPRRVAEALVETEAFVLRRVAMHKL
jgi:hypothetical protein